MPSIQRTDLNDTTLLLNVTVTSDELKPKIDAELKRYRQKAHIKGFRQGQAPMEYVKKMIGTSLLSETFERLIVDELMRYLREEKLDVLGQPLPTEDQQQFSFRLDHLEDEYSIRYEVGYVPPFELKGLDKSETYERLVPADLDELAEKDLDDARRRMGGRTHPEDNIEANDLVRIASHELDGPKGKRLEGGWATDITVHLDSLSDEGFKKELLTKKKGDTVRFNAGGLETQHNDTRYRKYILSLPDDDERAVGDWFEGTIEEVSRIGEAEMNQEFFTQYFGEHVTSREEAIEELKKAILGFYESRTGALLMREFQDRLLALNPVTLPDTFLQRWLRVTSENGVSAETVENEYPAFAENLRWSIIRDKVKEQFGVEVTEEEVEAEYARMVRAYFKVDLPDNVMRQSVERLMQDPKEVDRTRKNLEWDKLYQVIRDQVTIVDKPIPSEEIHQIFETASRQAQEAQGKDATLQEAVAE